MTKRTFLVLAALVVVGPGCGGDRQITGRPAAPEATGEAAQAPAGSQQPPRHAPTCPMPALGPISDPDAPVDGMEGMDRIATPRGGDRCETADSNLARVEAAILAGRRETPALGSKPWDRRRTPQRMAMVSRRLALSAEERKRITTNGFVVLDRHPFASYAYAYHEIYQSQLPIFVSIDSILHAIYIGNDNLIADLEDQKLAPQLARVIDALACALPAAAAGYPAETRRDLDLYLTVARELLRGGTPASMFGDPEVEAEAGKLIANAVAASEMTETKLFGRPRVIDFTAYTPRGHYAANEARQRFFRAGMWLSRLEFNLVSRSSRSSQPGTVPDPAETPREAVLALALADLVDAAGVSADVGALDTAWALLAGKREDISVAELAQLRKTAGIAKLTEPDAAERLRKAIGERWQRTARLHYMPQGSSRLPAIATLLGPRVVPDAAATRPLVHGEVPDRTSLRAADMAYVLGHDRALAHLTAERARFPSLERQLAVARDIVRDTPRGRDDLYSAWLDAVIGLGRPAPGALPSFAATTAYADLRINSALAAFGHIKHNYVLMVGESYFEGGCEIPDGYVEPAPATYAALLDYAARGERAFAVLDPADDLRGRAYFQRLGRLLQVLRTIQDDELADRPLTADQRAFLSMVAEMEAGTTGGPPTYTGWWFDMFRRRELDGLAPADYIASFFTGDTIAYVGATTPRLGVFVVDTGGAPRVAVGPVIRAYEHQGPVARRLDDEAGRKLPEPARLSPWAASYAAPAPPEPAFHIEWTPGPGEKIKLEIAEPIGPVTLEIYDHHRVPITKHTFTPRRGKTAIDPKLPRRVRPSGIHVHIGKFDTWIDISEVGGGLWHDSGGWGEEPEGAEGAEAPSDPPQ